MFTGLSWPHVLRPREPCYPIVMFAGYVVWVRVNLAFWGPLLQLPFCYIIFALTLLTYESWFRRVAIIQKTGYWVLGDGGLSWYSQFVSMNIVVILFVMILPVLTVLLMPSSAIFTVIWNTIIVIHKFCTFVTGNNTITLFSNWWFYAAMNHTSFELLCLHRDYKVLLYSVMCQTPLFLCCVANGWNFC